MPCLTRKHPAYRRHASGQAVVRLNGRDFYLGPHGTAVSRSEHDRVVAEWLNNGRRLPASSGGQSDLTVNELLLAYWKFAEEHYVSDGKQADHLTNVKYALSPVKTLYGHCRAAEFKAEALETVRRAMIDSKRLCRNTINNRIGKVRSVFRWAVSKKLIPVDVLHELCSVKGLEKGRAGVRQTRKVKPVPDEHVVAVLPHVTAPIRAMIELQHLTGMRPGEVVIMRGVDVDRSGEVWAYSPAHHKCENVDLERVIFLGPKAQAILSPWLVADPTAFLFRPSAAVESRNASRRAARKTPMTPSQRARKRKADRKRPPRDRYDKNAYGQAIVRACDKAGVPRWRPNRLRHSLGTQIRRLFGVEGAQVVLGHAQITTTQIDAERDMDQAREIMRQVG